MTTVRDNRNPLVLDRERVTCLLLINTHLMKKSINIYNNMFCNPQAMQSMPQEAKQLVADSYQNCIRRLHCNLTVLNYIHEQYHNDPSQQSSQTKASFPIILSAPTDMPELTELYNKLQDLYPEAMQYIKIKLQQMRRQHYQQEQQQGAPPQGQQPPPPQSQAPPQQQQQKQQIHNRQLPQQQMMSNNNAILSKNSGMIGTPNSNGLGTPQQDFVQQQYFNGGSQSNINFSSPMLQNVPTQGPQSQNPQQHQQQQQVQAISPQQILQQMNLGQSNPNTGIDYL
ncbi:hypothetical protein DFJ63DRAFT_153010 [Scheffersomyces coipomensis]|uniref:uncharacterized protein n=1 Tax=Scheffersomyces coipomensis TaxID=1788519 RepID=UPI00315CB8F0